MGMIPRATSQGTLKGIEHLHMSRTRLTQVEFIKYLKKLEFAAFCFYILKLACRILETLMAFLVKCVSVDSLPPPPSLLPPWP